ncbi:MAG: hypothetical protein DLM58_07415 [Pseudonocardiales bacterium]|nr:MAG: hypothetical protein DLM58_07415 [Pseudonocardiales bacterium]
MSPFDGNDYRKRVLAAVHRRGGPDFSDAFELYDITLEEADRLTDVDAAAQVVEVWGFWQRQRDHPKYGSLVTLLVESHEERSAALLDGRRRRALVDRIRATRDERDAARYELLDGAIRRLVDRHRGLPRDKIDGLIEIGALGGLSAAEVQARLRHHRLVDPVAVTAPAAGAVVSAHRRRQVRDLLDEFGRLNEAPPPATLLSLLGLEIGAPEDEIAQRAESWRVRCRELPPLRIRAVADELLVHVRDLLESGPPMLDAYLDAVAEDVTERLRPRARAAVLVEDRLVADDYQHLCDEARALGLDDGRARAVLVSIAAEFGVVVETGPARPVSSLQPPHAPAGRAWEKPLRAARAALRRGALREARRLVEQARVVAGAGGTTPIRAVADEIAEALAQAELRWRAAATALAARRFAEAVEHLEYVCRTAVDVAGPVGLRSAEAELARAQGEVAEADRQVETVLAGPDPAAALLAILRSWPQHPSAVAALAGIPLRPPGAVSVTRDRTDVVVVSWQPSPTADVTYRVSRRGADGSWRVIGRTAASRMDDGGAPRGGAPQYAVAAVQAGRASEEVRSGDAHEAVPPQVAGPTRGAIRAPADVAAERASGGSVIVSWTGPAGAEFKVSRCAADGRWRVIGRTRGVSIEDGGVAGSGGTPVYAVSARLDGVTSAETYSS